MACHLFGAKPLPEPNVTLTTSIGPSRIKFSEVFLTHWGRVKHICVGKLTIIGSDNGLSPERRQAIIWTNAGILLIGPLGTNFSEILIKIQTFSLKKIHLKMSSAKCCSFRLGLNVLNESQTSSLKKMHLKILSAKWWPFCSDLDDKNQSGTD